MNSSRLQPSESCYHRQFEYHPPGLHYIDGIVTYFGFQFTFHLGLWIVYWVTVLHIYNIYMWMNRFNGTTIIQHCKPQALLWYFTFTHFTECLMMTCRNLLKWFIFIWLCKYPRNKTSLCKSEARFAQSSVMMVLTPLPWVCMSPVSIYFRCTVPRWQSPRTRSHDLCSQPGTGILLYWIFSITYSLAPNLGGDFRVEDE